jgi:uncharacterized protein YeaO (DUF488 family)
VTAAPTARRKGAAASRRRPQAKATRRKPPLIHIKRAYDPPARTDGMRILIDRLWPRGLAKDALKLDTWAKDLAPSHALRRWYGHEPGRFAEFRRRYLAELDSARDRLDDLRAAVRGHTATLLTATRELDLSHATVLRDVLQDAG